MKCNSKTKRKNVKISKIVRDHDNYALLEIFYIHFRFRPFLNEWETNESEICKFNKKCNVANLRHLSNGMLIMIVNLIIQYNISKYKSISM